MSSEARDQGGRHAVPASCVHNVNVDVIGVDMTVHNAKVEVIAVDVDDDEDTGDFLASIHIDDHRCSSSQAMDPILAVDHDDDHQQISAVLPLDHTVGKVLIEEHARIYELDSSKLILEPVDPSIEEGLMESILDHSIDDSLSAPPEDSDDIDLLPHESNNRQLPTMCEETRDAQVNGGETTMKKEEHNAKERIRRRKQHAAYLALGALLPTDSSISKKRNSSRLILDRAVEYIPELEKEIEKLTLRKNDMLSAVKHKQSAAVNHLQLHLDPSSVSVHEIQQGEFIVQIFTPGHENGAFSNLLQNVEGEEQGMSIMSASTLQISDRGHCYHLHIKMKKMLDGEINIASLREKLISWFC
ncbi:transcription factor bHLH160 [Hibiscus syriacus]|uniref:transcription factor bHLH160 n=1 Tax=Hibiscus syriacus TaxID=106335 RepID=UPI0019228089|nr:transcription factor bHLH160 [Hibiscus syriacus]